MSIYHHKRETRAERKKRMAAELRRDHEAIKQGLIEAQEEGMAFPLNPHAFDDSIISIEPPPPAA